MSEMVERCFKALREKARNIGADPISAVTAHALTIAVIEAMRELPEEPGPRYTAGEYSRKTQAAMVDDALSAR